MSIGYSGAHRSGKTTLAERVSSQLNLPMIRTTASGVYQRLNLDPRADYSFEKRLEIQRHILDDFHKLWAKENGHFVSDRTPLDIVAYTLADVQRETVNVKTDAILNFFLDDCFMVANEVFNTVIMIQPGIAIVEDASKAPGTFGYVEHINAIIMGLCVSENVTSAKFYLPRSVTSLEERVKHSLNAIERSKERLMNRAPNEKLSSFTAVRH